MTITPEEVARLAAAATPGPWLRINALVYALHRVVDWKGKVNRFQAHVLGNGKSGAPDEELEANAAFMAAAHDMAALIAELKAERDALVEAMDAVASYNDASAQAWSDKHPEFAAAMIAERDRYGTAFRPEVFIARHLRAALAKIKETPNG